MANTKRSRVGPGAGENLRQQHRVQILASLIAICRQFERMQVSIEARHAGRDVVELLEGALVREQINLELRRR